MKLQCLNALADATIEMPLNFEYGGIEFKFTAQVKVSKNEQFTSSDIDTAKKLLIGWHGFVDDGKDVPFSKDTLNEMLAYPAIARKLATECVNAQFLVQEKN